MTNPKFSVLSKILPCVSEDIPGSGSANPRGRKPWLKMRTSLQQWLAEQTGKWKRIMGNVQWKWPVQKLQHPGTHGSCGRLHGTCTRSSQSTQLGRGRGALRPTPGSWQHSAVGSGEHPTMGMTSHRRIKMVTITVCNILPHCKKCLESLSHFSVSLAWLRAGLNHKARVHRTSDHGAALLVCTPHDVRTHPHAHSTPVTMTMRPKDVATFLAKDHSPARQWLFLYSEIQAKITQHITVTKNLIFFSFGKASYSPNSVPSKG